MNEALQQTKSKSLMRYFTILIIVSLLLLGAKLALADSMVIYVQNKKADILQAFFPADGIYSEENSERSPFAKNQTNGIRIPLPLMPIDHIRIDPNNEAGEIVISKIELKHLFDTETYLPADLLTRIKPIQMIDKVEITPAGLLIRSTGNDSAFELQLDKYSETRIFLILGIMSIFISIAIYLGIQKFAYLKIPTINEKVYLLTIPLFISIGVAALFYPGFMSYDTLHALRGARNGVTDSMWPPMVSYVWRVVDHISSNPSAMHFSQVYLLIGSSFYIVYLFTQKIKYATVFILLLLSIPVILGTVAVIWKDVLMASFFLAGFLAIYSMKIFNNKWQIILLSVLTIFFIFLGTCSRHNAILGAVPLLFFFASILSSKIAKKRIYIIFTTFLLGSVLTGVIFTLKVQLDHYSLPELAKLNSSTDDFIESVRVLDVAGASVCMERNLFGNLSPDLTIEDIKIGYDPKHVNLSKAILDRVPIDDRINQIWINVAMEHPVCFLYNKYEMTKYLIGAHQGTQFLITSPAIDTNEYGYILAESRLRELTVSYIIYASKITLFKPWLLYLLSIVYFIYMLQRRMLKAEHITLFFSAFFYLGGLILFGNAADARLPFYTTATLCIFLFVSFLTTKKRIHKQN